MTRREKPMTPQAALFSGLETSVREGAKALRISHPTFSRYLRGYAVSSRPHFDAEFTAYVEQHRATNTSHEHNKEELPMLTQHPMPEDALKHWGMNRDPFGLELLSGDDIVDLKELTKAERKILRAIEKQEWCIITGEVGSGKTTLMRRLKEKLSTRPDVRLVLPRLFEPQKLSASHICSALIDDLGLEAGSSIRASVERTARLVGETLQSYKAEGLNLAIIIDEAHLLQSDALKALKRIYDVKTQSHQNTLGIVLIGQPFLARRLRGDITLSEVTQRVDLFELHSLNGSSKLYLQKKLERAGLGTDPFTDGAVKLIAARAHTPLAFNNLVAAALIAGWEVGAEQISVEIIKSVYGGR
ncbi:MAG: ExeA family protein [Candidatus Binatia bacterium]